MLGSTCRISVRSPLILPLSPYSLSPHNHTSLVAADAMLKSPTSPTRLLGIAIGNGWIDPATQYPAYVEFAVKQNLLKVDSKEYKHAMDLLKSCQEALNSTSSTSPMTPHLDACESVMGATVDHLHSTCVVLPYFLLGCFLTVVLLRFPSTHYFDQRFTLDNSVNGKTMCLNVYDIRLSDTWPSCGMNWPPSLAFITPYLRRDDVRTALHVPSAASSWSECRGSIGAGLEARKSVPSVGLLGGLLERGVRVMLFHGDQDLICNYVGGERLIENLEWNGAKGFNVRVVVVRTRQV